MKTSKPFANCDIGCTVLVEYNPHDFEATIVCFTEDFARVKVRSYFGFHHWVPTDRVRRIQGASGPSLDEGLYCHPHLIRQPPE